MADEQDSEPLTPPPLGPGEDDPKSPARDTAAPVRGPLGPGESVGVNPDDALEMFTPPPASPGGEPTSPRRITRFSKRQTPQPADKE